MYKRLWIVIIALLVAMPCMAAGTAATKSAAPKSKPAHTQPKTNKAKPARKPIALPRLVDVGANQCIPCKMMISVLDELKKEYTGKLRVEAFDITRNPGAQKTYRVRMIPTQVLYDGRGKEIARHQGFWPKADIIAEFKKHGVKLTK